MLIKLMMSLIILAVFGQAGGNDSEEMGVLKKNRKYNLSVCAIFKNKAFDLRQWIEYHRIIGVDHFYLYNLASSDFYQYTLAPFIHDGIVTLVNWPDPVGYGLSMSEGCELMNTWIPAYENAVNFLAREETKWLIFMEIDEFLECPNADVLKLLEQFDDCTGISLHSDTVEKKKQLFAGKNKSGGQSLRLLSAQEIPKKDRQVMKMIFKPDQCVGFLWPPYECRFKEEASLSKIDPNKLSIVCYVNSSSLIHVEKKSTTMHDGIYCVPEEYECPLQRLNSSNRVYEQVPEFLKKLLIEKSNGDSLSR